MAKRRGPKRPWQAMFDIQVEPLSGSVSVKALTHEVDDFTGEPLAIVNTRKAQQLRHDAKVLEDYLQRQRVARAEIEQTVQAMNERRLKLAETILARKMGLLPHEPTLAHNQVKTESGLIITVGGRRTWRRV